MVGVYCIICLKTRKIYIGQSINIAKRLRDHKYLLRRNTHNNAALQKAWNRHGEDFFKFFVVEEISKRKLLARENYWINTLKVFNPSIGYNKNKFKVER